MKPKFGAAYSKYKGNPAGISTSLLPTLVRFYDEINAFHTFDSAKID